jgi:heme A synthase
MLPVVIDLHLYNAFLVVATGAITAIWGLILYFRQKTMDIFPQSLKVALLVTAADGLLQGLLGALLLLMGQRAPGGDLYYLHYVYGAIVVFAIPVGYTYIGKDARKAALVLSLAALILALAGTRGLMTGLGMA